MTPPTSTQDDELRRLAALRQYAVLDTLPEQALDDLTALAAQICEAPIALISLVDERRQWFKSKVGLEVAETPRDVSFCAHALHQPDLLIVPDTTQDERFAQNPFVLGEPGIRFYAGAPLVSPEGATLGTLCVIDRVPRTLTSAQEQALRVLARQVMTHLELRRHTRKLTESEERSRAIVESGLDAVLTTDHENRITEFNPAAEKMFGWSRAEVLGRKMAEVIFPAKLREAHCRGLAPYLETSETAVLDRRIELTGLRADGTEFPIELTATRLGRTSPPKFTAFLRDITERKQTEQALEEKSTQLQAALNVAGMGVWVVDLRSDEVATLQGSGPISGLAGEVAPKTTPAFLALVHPEDRAAVREKIQRARAGEDYAPEFRIVLPGGEVRWVAARGRCLRDANGEPAVLTGVDMDITERKRVTEALMSSEREQRELAAQLETERARLVAAQTVAKVGSWETDLSTLAMIWSAETFRIFETDPAQFRPTHQGFLQFVHPDDRATVDRAFVQSFDHSSPCATEHRLLMADGRIKFVEERWQVFHDEQGKPFIAIGTCQDITERKLAEEAEKRAEDRVRLTIDTIPTMVWSLGPDGAVDFVNQRWMDYTGLSMEEEIEKPTDIVHSEDLPRVMEKWLANMAAGEIFEDEMRLRRADGEYCWFLVRTAPLRDEQGGIVKWFGSSIDIEERKRTEARFRRLVDSNAQGVLFWNTKGEITGGNDAFLRIVGYTREDLEAGHISWLAVTPPEYADFDRRGLEEIAVKGFCTPFEKEYIRKDGSRVPVLVGAAVFEDSPEEGVCFVLDLTERKKLEQQALRSQRMESIGTLAGGIAHDLNNSLGPIITALDLLQMKFPDPDSQELFAILSSSAQRGADMVRQVLSFARGVEGRRMEVQIRHLVQDIEKIANDTFLKHIQVRTIIPNDLWTVLGDPTQLHQVLLNLCVNARDAMPNGGTLTISAENLTLDAHYAGLNLEAKPGPYVFLQVKDSGTGVPPEAMEKIFDPFFTTKEVGKGTGLGLSTSLGIVKSHGGFIQVDSELEKGTKFRIYLPAQTEASPATVAERAAEMPRGRGELILVVDDEASVRQITQQTLEAFGYRVVVASDGPDAVAVFARQGAEIAAVLTDMTMPVMDGLATIQVLRKMNPKVPIIAASGLSASDHVAKVAGLGVKHFLPKPYTAEILLKTLKEVLSAEAWQKM
jgi:PAS domain S-box-containing protein